MLHEQQRANLINVLNEDLLKVMGEESLSYDKAFINVALDYLGYDIDVGTISDGRSDHGIDYYEVSSDQAIIHQYKSHDYTESLDKNFKIRPNHITDINRIFSLLDNLDNPTESINSHIERFVKSLRDSIHEMKVLNDNCIDNEEDDGQKTYIIKIFFVALAHEFTQQAKEEFDNYANDRTFEYDEVTVNVTVEPIFIDKILEARWLSSNTQWKNHEGSKQDNIEVEVVGGDKAIISEHNWCVFFGKARDLVKAYNQLGYQIFEPNVRCELKNSSINKEIKKSVSTSPGRKQFRHFNNGLTITCDSFSKPSGNRNTIKITHPGIINGLQTVKSLHDAYSDLSSGDKANFDDECDVLIRLHNKNSVKNANALIRATNNQNPMQPRNLRSNEPEQISFQSLFGKMNWFYCRKEQEWRAFKDNERGWPQLGGKRKRDFSTTSGQKKVDNLDLAQAYFSFIGYTTEALNKKKSIFLDDSIYNAIFKYRVVKHSEDYGLNFLKSQNKLFEESQPSSPSPEIMLVAYLAREAAKNFSIEQTKSRKAAKDRINTTGKSAEEINALILDDSEYIKEYVLRGTFYIFVELVGYILFSTFGAGTHEAAKKLLANGSFKIAFQDYDFTSARDKIDNESYEDDDLLIIFWLIYKEIISGFSTDPSWVNAWKAESNRSRYHYSEHMRAKIINRIKEFDAMAKRNPLLKVWSTGIDKHQGIYNYVKKTLGVS